MNRTIELTPKFTKWIYLFNGSVNFVIGLRIIIQMKSWTHWTTFLAIILIVGGPLLIMYSIILFNPSNKLTPAIELDEVGLKIRRDSFKKLIQINWTDIKEITYRSFKLDFRLIDDSIKTVNLPTTPDKSIEIKKSIREICEDKEITVVGG